MRKFTVRESFLIVTALEEQKKETVKELLHHERQGKRPMFTPGYVEREHDDLIETIKINSKKDKYAKA